MVNFLDLLPDDILAFVAEKLNLKDQIRFSSVFRSWRLIYKEIIKNSRLSNSLPLLMLPIHIDDNKTCSLYSIADNKLCDIQVPVADNRFCSGSSFGWLVTVNEDVKDEVYSVSLLNPILSNEIHLPPLPTKLPHERFFRKAVLSADPLSNPNYMVMAICGDYGTLALLRPGGAWIPLSHRSDEEFYNMDDLIYYRDQFYALNYKGEVFICDCDSSRPTISRFAHSPPSFFHGDCKVYLVESASTGDLLKIARLLRYDEGDGLFHSSNFQVFKLNTDKNEWIEINDLHGCILFIGMSSSLSLVASHYEGCKPNTIYFTDDLDAVGMDGNNPQDMGVYDLEDGIIRPHYPHSCTKVAPIPIWLHVPIRN